MKPNYYIEYPILTILREEDFKKAIASGEELGISVDTASDTDSRHVVVGNLSIHIQWIKEIRNNRWVAKGNSFDGKHELLIFCDMEDGRIRAKKIRFFRAGLKVSV